MEKEPRKATDVLLELESKLDVALNIIRTQDLNIKLLSNKLNSILEKLEKQNNPTNKIVVEAVTNSAPATIDNEKNILISSEDQLSVDLNPQGFRRTSRPETFSGDDSYLSRPPEITAAKYPVQIPTPKSAVAEVVVPSFPAAQQDPAPNDTKPKQKSNSSPSVPVIQRIVDKNGKSIFLADVEVIDLGNGEQVVKTRTNGTGKWMANLSVGNYRVMIRKRESVSREKMEVGQDIYVDGSQSPLELQTMIIK